MSTLNILRAMRNDLDKAIANLEADEARVFQEPADERMSRLLITLLESGAQEGVRYKASELEGFLSISEVELDSFRDSIPNFGGPKSAKLGRLLTVMSRKRFNRYIIREGVNSGCKTYRIEKLGVSDD